MNDFSDANFSSYTRNNDLESDSDSSADKEIKMEIDEK